MGKYIVASHDNRLRTAHLLQRSSAAKAKLVLQDTEGRRRKRVSHINLVPSL